GSTITPLKKLVDHLLERFGCVVERHPMARVDLPIGVSAVLLKEPTLQVFSTDVLESEACTPLEKVCPKPRPTMQVILVPRTTPFTPFGLAWVPFEMSTKRCDSIDHGL